MRDDRLLSTADLVATGETVDWSDVLPELTPSDRSLAHELSLVARIARECRRLDLEGQLDDEDTPARRVGDRWGSLELLEVVGRGAFGTVFRCWDSKLERDVALKLFRRDVDPDRVIDEGRRLAKVRHVNVVTVFGADVIDGVAGIWMEFVRGRRLDQVVGDHGPFDAREASLVGLELAGALASVHAAGLIHRDIKAQNVMREPGGRIVLMDLGASLSVVGAATQHADPDLVGTPSYMAPELFALQPATRASDIYSLGVLLFYLATGRFPIAARTLEELRLAHRAGTSCPLGDLRPDLEPPYVSIVTRMTASRPADRYGSAVDLERDLRTFTLEETRSVRQRSDPERQPAIRRPAVVVAALAAAVMLGVLGFLAWQSYGSSGRAVQTIAVLPVRNLTNDPSLDYLAEGMTDVLITNLARLHALRVPSYAAVLGFRDPSMASATVADKLGATLLLTASIRSAGDRLRMTAQLIDPRRDQTVWAQEFSRDRRDALATQAEIARLVAAHLSLKLTPAEQQGLTQRPVSADAQDAYLRGLVDANSPSDRRQLDALAHFRRAIDLEPAFAEAWAASALVQLRVADTSSVETRVRSIDDVREAAVHAIELDPGLASGYAALGAVHFYYDWDFAAAEVSFRKSIELSPSYAFVHCRYSMFLAALRRFPEAITEGQTCRDLEPLRPVFVASYAFIYYYMQEYPRAKREMQQALAIDPSFATAHFGLGRIASAMGNQEEAIREINTALVGAPNGAWLAELARVYTVANRPADARRALDELEVLQGQDRFGASGDTRAYTAAAAGRTDDAFRQLDEAVRNKVTSLLWIAVDPRADPLRADPRFDQLLAQMGLR